MIPARINFVTLGVADLDRASAFYERLGWQRKTRAFEAHIRFFALDNLVLGLFPRAALVEDAGLPAEADGAAARFSGVTLSINLASEAEVDRTFAAMVEAGARLLKRPVKADWGGYSGYVADPDGHAWEIAWNPVMPLNAQGGVTLDP